MKFDEQYRQLVTTWFDQALLRWIVRMEQALTQSDQLATDEPLPPLDELDEGLTCVCCGRQPETFGEYITHMREHRWDHE
jgi:hypothetical protein